MNNKDNLDDNIIENENECEEDTIEEASTKTEDKEISNNKEDEVQEQTSDLSKKYESKEKEFEELNSKYMRLQADFMNFKRRQERDRQNIYDFAVQDLLKELLPLLDNFERALDSSKKEEINDGFYEGIQMLYKQFIDTLSKNGLKEIEAKDQKFDPNVHNAVMQEQSDEHEEGTVIEVFQKGYKLKDRVIRPSMVKVSN